METEKERDGKMLRFINHTPTVDHHYHQQQGSNSVNVLKYQVKDATRVDGITLNKYANMASSEYNLVLTFLQTFGFLSCVRNAVSMSKTSISILHLDNIIATIQTKYKVVLGKKKTVR